MSHWQASARSNYVKVKPEKLTRVLQDFDEKGIKYVIDSQKGLMFYSQDIDVVLNADMHPDVDFIQNLVPDQVLVIMTARMDGHDYVGGDATAYHTDGRVTWISLEDIYAQAYDEFNVEFISRAED